MKNRLSTKLGLGEVYIKCFNIGHTRNLKQILGAGADSALIKRTSPSANQYVLGSAVFLFAKRVLWHHQRQALFLSTFCLLPLTLQTRQNVLDDQIFSSYGQTVFNSNALEVNRPKLALNRNFTVTPTIVPCFPHLCACRAATDYFSLQMKLPPNEFTSLILKGLGPRRRWP